MIVENLARGSTGSGCSPPPGHLTSFALHAGRASALGR